MLDPDTYFVPLGASSIEVSYNTPFILDYTVGIVAGDNGGDTPSPAPSNGDNGVNTPSPAPSPRESLDKRGLSGGSKEVERV